MQVLMERLARAFAFLGGAVLSFLIVMVCASIIGRSLNGVLHSDVATTWMPEFAAWLLAIGVGPINGDFEIVEAGVAFAIFAFLPLCQLTGAHASVDIFMSYVPQRLADVIRAIVEVVFAAVLILIAWQLGEGTMSKFRTGQTTFLLEFPVWWSYAASLVAMVVAAVVGVYVAWCRCAEVVAGRSLPESGA